MISSSKVHGWQTYKGDTKSDHDEIFRTKMVLTNNINVRKGQSSLDQTFIPERFKGEKYTFDIRTTPYGIG